MKNNQMPQFNPGQLDTLLQMASNRLGVSPEVLKQQLQNGQLPKGVDASSVTQMLGDPKKLDALLSSKVAQQFIQNLINKK